MLQATDLFCERDDRILFQALNFSLDQGQVMQIKGANGSGKTTLLCILCGLNPDFRGQVSWRGEPVAHNRARFYEDLFYLGHLPAIKKVLTARENLRWFCATQGGNEAAIGEALTTFGLKGYDDVPCYMMSAGQQRRVSLARLELTPACLWILDEPFTALDLKGVGELEVFLADHAKAGGSVILTTHHTLAMPCDVTVLDLDARGQDSVLEGA